MKKNGQLTIFIIIGILIVLIIMGIVAIRTGILNFNKEKINPEFTPVYDFVKDCIKITGEEAIYHIGLTGGYVVVPETEKSLDFDNESDAEIAYYFYNKENHMPSKEQIEKELSFYIDNFIYFCINDFRDFPDFDVKQGEAKTTAKIENNKIIFSVNYPLSIKKENKTSEIKYFNDIEIPVRLSETYLVSEEIIKKQMENKEEICFSCLEDIGDRYNMSIQMMESVNDSIVFVVRDEQSKIYGGDYLFYFVNQY